jgi:hypothetical protein
MKDEVLDISKSSIISYFPEHSSFAIRFLHELSCNFDPPTATFRELFLSLLVEILKEVPKVLFLLSFSESLLLFPRC